MEQNQNNQPGLAWQVYTPPKPVRNPFSTGKKELIFGIGILLCAFALCNFIVWGGFNLGFSVAVSVMILVMAGYLLLSGCKPSLYSLTLLGLSVVIACGFGRSSDFLVKFVMLCFLMISINLGLCLLAGQNLRPAGVVGSLLDAPCTLIRLGFGKYPEAFRGLAQLFRRSGKTGKAGGAVLLGLAMAVPILAMVIPLLMSADAAFDGLVQLLPQIPVGEIVVTVLLGGGLGSLVYTMGTALRHAPKEKKKETSAGKGLNTLTVNTVLSAVCFVYGVYLLSQLAYLAGGFAGLLPEEYTLAEYARRGFFEMSLLCTINLGVIILFLSVRGKKEPAPLSTRLLCLFVCVVTLFLVAAASAKMFLYIETFGLTRLRVLTQVIMLFVGITTVLVTAWLFLPKLPYMKAVIVVGLVIGAVVMWADVDTVVARYNVEAYLSGKTQTVDVAYLQYLSDGAVPYIAKLAEQAPNVQIAEQAQQALENRACWKCADFRGWNYANAQALEHLSRETS